MKKLLLYLMALLAFGSIPVNSFAEDYYFKSNADPTNQISINNNSPQEKVLSNAKDGVYFQIWAGENGSIEHDTYWSVSVQDPQVNVKYQLTKDDNKPKVNPFGWWDKKVRIEVENGVFYVTFVQSVGSREAYFKKGSGDFAIWFWRESQTKVEYANNMGFTWNSSPKLNVENDLKNLWGSVVNINGEDYYKVYLPEDTDQIILNWGGGTKDFDFDYVWDSNGKTNVSVEDLLRGGDTPDPAPDNLYFYINSDNPELRGPDVFTKNGNVYTYTVDATGNNNIEGMIIDAARNDDLSTLHSFANAYYPVGKDGTINSSETWSSVAKGDATNEHLYTFERGKKYTITLTYNNGSFTGKVEAENADPELYFYLSNATSSSKFSQEGTEYTYTIDATNFDVFGVIVDRNAKSWDEAHSANAYFANGKDHDIEVSGPETWSTITKWTPVWQDGCYKFAKGKKYIITLTYANGSFTGKVEVEGETPDPTPNYSDIEVWYKADTTSTENEAWKAVKLGNLNSDGTLIKTIKLGNNAGFNFWFDGSSKEYRSFTYNGNGAFNIDVNTLVNCVDSQNGESYVALNEYNTSKDKDKSYEVVIDYVNKTIQINGEVSGPDPVQHEIVTGPKTIYIQVPGDSQNYCHIWLKGDNDFELNKDPYNYTWGCDEVNLKSDDCRIDHTIVSIDGKQYYAVKVPSNTTTLEFRKSDNNNVTLTEKLFSNVIDWNSKDKWEFGRLLTPNGYKAYFNHSATAANNGAVTGWNSSNADGTAFAEVNGQWVANHNSSAIDFGQHYFIVKVSNGTYTEYFGLGSKGDEVESGKAVKLTKYASGSLHDHVMKIKNAKSGSKYYASFNYDTQEITLKEYKEVPSSYYHLLIQFYDEATGEFEEKPSVDIPVVNGQGSEVVELGNRKFVFGYQDFTDGDDGTIKWYRMNQLSQTYPVNSGKGVIVYATTSLTDYSAQPAKKRWLANVSNAGENDKFTVVFNNTSSSNPEIKFIPDFTGIRVHYGKGENIKSSQIDSGGGYMFTYKTGDKETDMQLWFELPNGGKRAFGSSEGKSLNLKEEFMEGMAYGYPLDGEWLVVDDSTPLQAKTVSGLSANTFYNVYVSYSDKSICFEEVPELLYLQGTFGGKSINTNLDEWQLTSDLETEKDWYIKRNVTLQPNDHIQIVTSEGIFWDPGTESNHYYIDDLSNNQYDWRLYEHNNKHYMFSNASQKVDILVYWPKDPTDENYRKIVIRKAADVTLVEPDKSSMTLYYGNNYKYVHTTDGATYSGNGDWVTIDNGYDYRGSIKENDGLALGYDNFYFSTVDQNGIQKFWIVDESKYPYVKEEGIVTDTPYVLKEVSEEAATSSNNYTRMAVNAGLVNTRYDVTFNWSNYTVTVTANQLWMEQPNQMYLYCLASVTSDKDGNVIIKDKKEDGKDMIEDLRRNYTGEYDADGYPIYTEATPAEVLAKVKAAMANNSDKVFVYDRTEDGVYEHIFSGDNDLDLPNGTYFCIVGRSGQVYNIATDDNTSYELNKDWLDSEDASYRMQLTRNFAQKPAVVTIGDLANKDAFSRIRANFTGSTTVDPTDENSDKDVFNTYTFTLELKQEAPVKFVLKGTDGSEIEVANIPESENYANNGEGLNKNVTYTVQAVYEDSSNNKWYKLPTANNGNIADGKEDYLTLWNKDETGYADLSVTTDALKDYSDISISWNNGRPLMTIRPQTVATTVKVFFIDRAGWDDVCVYNYSDYGLSYTNNIWTTSESARNADWPGEHMKRTMRSAILDGVSMDEGTKVFEFNLKAQLNADGSYVFPKVIFNDGKKEGARQTKNLYLVDGGIYTNEGKDKYVDENGKEHKYVKYPATDYLPRMWFNYMNDLNDQSVDRWNGTDYSTIYVDVPEFYTWATDGKSDHQVSVDILYRKDNADFHATGIPGKHFLYPVEISGKKMLRVALASDVLPNKAILKELSFFPQRVKGGKEDGDHWYINTVGKGGDQFLDEEGKNITKNDKDLQSVAHNGDKEPSLKSSSTDIKESTLSICDHDGNKLESAASDSYHGNHFWCQGSLCSLNFVDVDYRDGNVYRRAIDENGNAQDPIVALSTLIKPDAIYLATDANNENSVRALQYAVNSGLEAGNDQLVSGKILYRLTTMDTEDPEKLIYYVDGLRSQAQFSLIARNGNTFTDFSCQENTVLRNGDVNHYLYGGKGIYSIRPVTGATSYNLVITWTENEVVVRANKNSADFKYGIMEGNKLVVSTRGAVALPSHSDDCPLDGEMSGHLVPIYLEYAPGYDNYDNDATRLNKLQVKAVRNTEYDKYFPEGGRNKQIEIMKYQDGSIFKIEEPSVRVSEDGKTPAQRGRAVMYVKGYTAGLTSIHIEQTAVDEGFHRTQIDIPIRIYPSLQGIGLYVNNQEVTLNKNTKSYEVKIANEEFIVDGKNFRNKLYFAPTSAEYKIDGESVLEIYWAENKNGNQSRKRANTGLKTVNYGEGVFIPEGSDTNPFDKADSEGENLTLSRYHINNSPAVNLENGESKSIYLQVKQNGIDSPVYALNVNRDGGITTDVKEIFDVNEVMEADAVYYNLNGVKMNAERLEPGIYIRVQGNKSEKIFIR